MKQGRSKKPIGELLVAEELITQGQLLEALANRTVIDGRRERLGETIQRLGFVAPADMARIIAFQFGAEHIQDDHPLPDPSFRDLVPEPLARAHRVAPLRREDDGTVVLLTTDPGDNQGVGEISGMLDHEPIVAVGTSGMMDRVLATLYQGEANAPTDAAHEHFAPQAPEDALPTGAPPPPPVDMPPVDLQARAADPISEAAPPAVERTPDLPALPQVVAEDLPAPLDTVVGAAISAGAEQISHTPASGLRHRIHGVLGPAQQGAPSTADVAIALRSAAGEDDTDVTRLRVTTDVGEGPWTVDATILPTTRGDKVTMSLTPPIQQHRGLNDLGLTAEQASLVAAALRRDGVVHLVGGPARSGRTCTLSAIAAHLADHGRDVTGVSVDATPITPGADWVRAESQTTVATLAAAAIDGAADVLVIDAGVTSDVAAAALAAARRGVTVVLTADATDAADALVHLRSLAASPTDLGVLGLVLAQRLVRTVCRSCAQGAHPDADQAAVLRLSPEEAQHGGWRLPSGCHECRGTGLGGRTAILEAGLVDEHVGPALRDGADVDDLRAVLHQTGVSGLQDVAIDLGLQGVITAAEILRALPPTGQVGAGTAAAEHTPAARQAPRPSAPSTPAAPAAAASTPVAPAPQPAAEPEEALAPLPRRTRSAPATEAARSLFGASRAQQANQADDDPDEAAAPVQAPHLDADQALETARKRLEQMLQGID